MTESPLEEMAARLIREARTRAGLTQVQLAARAGVTQSVISAYESAKRQPSMPMLMDLVRASGMTLSVQVEPVTTHALDRLTGPIGRRVRERREEMVRVAAAHGAEHLRIFGSVARGDEHADSDVDLLAALQPGTSVYDLAGAALALEDLLGVPVDLVPEEGLKPDVRETITPELIAL